MLDSAILIRSDTTLELDNCRIKLSDRCRDNLLRSANCGPGITDISDVVHHGSAPEPVTLGSGPEHMRNVTITNVHSTPK